MKSFFSKIKNLGVSFLRAGKDTQMRTVTLFIALINMLVTQLGYNKLIVSSEEAWQWVTTVLVIVTSLIAWWNNNSYSNAALEADAVKHCLKCGEGENDNAIAVIESLDDILEDVIIGENDNSPEEYMIGKDGE